MTSSPRTMVIFGSGPSMGRAIASRFASEGFEHIVLLSRNAARLEEDKAAVLDALRNKNVRIDAIAVDLADQGSVQAALKQVDSLAQEIEVVLYNAARVAPTPLFETPAEDIVTDLKTTTIGLYQVSQWAIPKLQALAKASPASKPSLIVTSGVLHRDPWPTFFSLSLAKTAQRNLTESLHKAYNNGGVHIGLVLIAGIISPNAKALNPPTIAEKTWDFFDQEATKDTLEIEIHEP